MKELPKLYQLSIDEKDALIHELWEEIQRLRQEIAGEKDVVVEKTPDNSSIPPSKGFKKNTKSSDTVPQKRQGHQNGGRKLSEPAQIITAHAKVCPNCQNHVEIEAQKLEAVYEKIELPKIVPIVTQVHRYGGKCPHCEAKYVAPVPVGMEPRSPFGKSIEILATYLRYSHAISYERMTQLMKEVFGVKISEGGLAELFKRVKTRLDPQVQAIVERLQTSRLVCSDETSARVHGKNEWEWVFQNEEVCLHVIRPSRGTEVITEVMAGHKPEVWVSDLFSAQKNHPASNWQVCLAHQLRDCQYAIDAGDTIFAPVFKQILLRSFVIHKKHQKLSDGTRYQYRCDLNRRLKRALALVPEQKDGIRLQKRYRDIEEHLFLFLEDATIPPTNNSSEQALRLSVIFRKVTNGFRSIWGRDLFAAVRSIVNTGKRQELSAFEAIRNALSPPSSLSLLSP
jgi:transposase